MRPASSAHRTLAAPLDAAALSPDEDLAIGLVYLDRWPALPSQLTPEEVLLNRICALLSKKPRASHLIHLLLRAPKPEVQAALRGLLHTGCIHIGQASTVPGTGNRPLVTADPYDASADHRTHSAATVSSTALLPGVLGKLWHRLSS